jgi:hypothetical protein
VPALAQGKSAGKGNGNGHASKPPSRNVLAAPPIDIASSGAGAAPFAWIDDATVLEPGAGTVGLAFAHFAGADLSEDDVPIVEAALGVVSRVQLAVTTPHVVAGADASAAAGGIGTTFIAAKIGVLEDSTRHVKIAAAPTLEILGAGAAASLGSGERRTQFGLPISAEVDLGAVRTYASAGFFTAGVRFAGGGAAVQVAPRAVVSLGFSHAWRPDIADPSSTGTVRSEVSGGLGYGLLPRIALFATVARTVGTLDENGAGTTVSGGIAFSFTAPVR